MALFSIQRHNEVDVALEPNQEKLNLDIILKRIEASKSLQQEADQININESPRTEIEHEDTKVKETNDPSTKDTFHVLGVKRKFDSTKANRVLPEWLLHPTIISNDLQKLQTKSSHFKCLDKALRKRLKENGIRKLFPVQETIIPYILESNRVADIFFPCDICVSAPTGSGKTLAFVLPIVQILSARKLKRIRCLVVLPTRDLAIQVHNTFKLYAEDINVFLLIGNCTFEMEQQKLRYYDDTFGYVNKVDILVCTAGRLVDHLKMTEGFTLQYLEFLVIDEADRVLENIQNDWLHHVEKHIEEKTGVKCSTILNLNTLKNHRPPQKLLFSATLTQDPEKLEKLSIFQPKLFTCVGDSNNFLTQRNNKNSFIGKFTTPEELLEQYIVSSNERKPLVLYNFIKTEKLDKTLVFTHSIESAHRLTILLKFLCGSDLCVENIASNVKNRNQIISKFTKGSIHILVSTDCLTRGIDVSGVECVISYSAPKFLKTYIHRCGRTARAGEKGMAVTILLEQQVNRFKSLLKQCGKKDINEIAVDQNEIKAMDSHYQNALRHLRNTMSKEQYLKLKRTKLGKRSERKQIKRVIK